MRDLAATIFVLISAATASAEFVPGRIYISAVHQTPSQPPRIYEFDPATGQGGLFTQFNPGGGNHTLSSLSFSPDNTRLRAVDTFGHAIHDFDGAGSYSTAWGPGTGLALPGSGTYSAAGDFWVSQFGNNQPAILRFPGGQGPPQVFAQFPNTPFLLNDGEIAVDDDGFVYCSGGMNYGDILRFSPAGAGSIWATLPGVISSMIPDGRGDLFVWTGSGLYHVDTADPLHPTLVSTLGGLPGETLVLSPDKNSIYAISILSVHEIDLSTGLAKLLGDNPAPEQYFVDGAALFVPEPSTALLAAVVGLVAAACTPSRRPTGNSAARRRT